jgi:hypothetical protein
VVLVAGSQFSVLSSQLTASPHSRSPLCPCPTRCPCPTPTSNPLPPGHNHNPEPPTPTRPIPTPSPQPPRPSHSSTAWLEGAGCGCGALDHVLTAVRVPRVPCGPLLASRCSGMHSAPCPSSASASAQMQPAASSQLTAQPVHYRASPSCPQLTSNKQQATGGGGGGAVSSASCVYGHLLLACGVGVGVVGGCCW